MAPEEGATEVEEYKFTFVSCNMAGSGRYFACMRDFHDWYTVEHGESYEKAREGKDEARQATAIQLFNQANDFAAIVASLKSVEKRTRPLDDSQEPGPWQPDVIPEEWGTFAGFYDSMPWAAVGALADAAHAANPGLWRFLDNDSAKKNGGANAG